MRSAFIMALIAVVSVFGQPMGIRLGMDFYDVCIIAGRGLNDDAKESLTKAQPSDEVFRGGRFHKDWIKLYDSYEQGLLEWAGADIPYPIYRKLLAEM